MSFQKPSAPRFDESNAEDLSCSAHECPMPWTVDNGSRACSYHAWSSRESWPSITDMLLRNLAAGTLPSYERLQRDSEPQGHYTIRVSEKIARLADLAALARSLGKGDNLAWAKSLKARDEAGEGLTAFQRSAWRAALRRSHD